MRNALVSFSRNCQKLNNGLSNQRKRKHCKRPAKYSWTHLWLLSQSLPRKACVWWRDQLLSLKTFKTIRKRRQRKFGQTTDNLRHKSYEKYAKQQNSGFRWSPKRVLWHLLGPTSNLLLEVYKESLSTGLLPPSTRRGLITLLFKKGQKHDLKNRRPVTLVGVDVKIKALCFPK